MHYFCAFFVFFCLKIWRYQYYYVSLRLKISQIIDNYYSTPRTMNSIKLELSANSVIKDIRHIIDNARSNAARSVDFCRVQMYWNIGRRIFVEEQGEKDRADYGSYLIANIAKAISHLPKCDRTVDGIKLVSIQAADFHRRRI